MTSYAIPITRAPHIIRVLFTLLPFITFGSNCWSRVAEAQVPVEVLLAADTESKDIADAMQSNVAFLDSALAENIPTNQLRLHDLTGENWSRHKVLTTIARIPVRENQVFLFFYCGHGYYSNGTLFYPPFDNQQPLYLREILSAIREKRPRLLVSIVDCCSVMPPGRVVARPAPLSLSAKRFSPLFGELLTRTTGEIAINSSAPGEYALAGVLAGEARVPFSLFTLELLNSLREHQNEKRSWEFIIHDVKSRVATTFSQMRKNNQHGIPLADGRVLPQAKQTVWAIRNGQAWIPFD